MWFIVVPIGIVILYLGMIMPATFRRKDLEPLAADFFAHRGLHSEKENVPENSNMAFRRALERGFGIEMDVQLTKDEVPVVLHDNDLLRVCGEKEKVSELTYGQLGQMPLLGTGERVPKLSEVLRMVDGKVPLIVEIKSETRNMNVCRKAMELLLDYKGDYVIESFNPLVLLWFRLHHPRVIRGQLSTDYRKEGQEGNGLLLFMMKNLMFNFLTKPDFIAINHLYQKTLSFQICKKWYKAPILIWNVASVQDYRANERKFHAFIFDGFVPKEPRRSKKG